MKNQILTFVLFLFSSLLIAQISPKEKQALIDLYLSTNGENWVNTWNLNEPVAQWHGVTLVDNKVTAISMLFNNLEGNIPQSIGNLENLKVLELPFNKLSGEIPTTIGNLKNLEILVFNGNNLTGGIPASVGSMESLKKLHLSSNLLSGNVPISVSNLRELELLNVFDNNLSGTLPLGLAQLKNLKKLVVAENELIETQAFSSLLLFIDDTNLEFNNSLTPSAKTVIAIETSDDGN